MNGSLTILWILLFGLLILIAVLAILGSSNYVDGNVVTINNTITKCEPPFDLLPDVSSLPCCVVGGNLTSNKYYAPIDMVISNFPTAFPQACAGFCTQGVNSEDSRFCINGVGQSEYTNCVGLIKPTKCIGTANPVGYVGINYYYGFSASNLSCLNTQPCS